MGGCAYIATSVVMHIWHLIAFRNHRVHALPFVKHHHSSEMKLGCGMALEPSKFRATAHSCWSRIEPLCARLELVDDASSILSSLRESQGRLKIWIGSYDSFKSEDESTPIDKELALAPQISQSVSATLEILCRELQLRENTVCV